MVTMQGRSECGEFVKVAKGINIAYVLEKFKDRSAGGYTQYSYLTRAVGYVGPEDPRNVYLSMILDSVTFCLPLQAHSSAGLAQIRRRNVHVHELHSALAAILLGVLQSANFAFAQSAPVSSDRPWHSAAERNIGADLRNIPDSRFTIDSAKTYSLPELIDMAEAHNPATRDSWERARAQAAALGLARSELLPVLGAVAVSETGRQEVLFGDRFNGQVLQTFQMELDLNYTLFDFGARTGRINAANAQLLAANFVFNDTHRQVIYQVQQAYYRLLSSMGQEDAARASLSNAQVVQRAAEQRLAHGLATQPDVLEVRSATAQAEYDLQAILGAEEIARGDLASAIGASAATVIQVQSLDQIPSRESIGDTVDQAINRALEQRPDLMQQVAEIQSENARVQEARAAYYPALTLNVTPAIPSLYGLQSPYPWSHTADLVGELRFDLQWTVFDGGARKNRVAQAQADVHAAEARVNVKRNQIADQVWTAYSNLNTAFRQRQSAVALLEASSQSYNAALQSYGYGVRNLLDVTAAQRTLAQARSADVLARTQVLTAFAELAFRTGDSIRVTGRPQP
jgi:outer membrane protein